MAAAQTPDLAEPGRTRQLGVGAVGWEFRAMTPGLGFPPGPLRAPGSLQAPDARRNREDEQGEGNPRTSSEMRAVVGPGLRHGAGCSRAAVAWPHLLLCTNSLLETVHLCEHVSKILACFRGQIPKEFVHTKPCVLRTWHRACGTSLPISCPAWKLLGGPDGSG